MVSAKRRRAARKAWNTRRRRFGKDGLSRRGKARIRAAARRRR